MGMGVPTSASRWTAVNRCRGPPPAFVGEGRVEDATAGSAGHRLGDRTATRSSSARASLPRRRSPLDENAHPRVMQGRAGHASSKLTMELYAHVTDEADRDAADALENRFARHCALRRGTQRERRAGRVSL